MGIKVSVIVPAYNVEKYIGRCLESLINQTLKEIEIIVINDGSVDSTSDILNKYAKNYSIIKVIHQENSGSSSARNRGIEEAKGKYIGYLDADDYVELNYYEEMVIYAEKNNLDIVISNFIKQTTNKTEVKQDFDIKGKEYIHGKEYIEEIFLGNGYPNVWDKIVLKSLYDEKKIRFEKGIFLGDDIIVTVKLGYFAKKVGKLEKAFVHYIQHESQGTSKKYLGDKIFDLYRVCENLKEFFGKENYNPKNFEWYRLNEFFIKFLNCYPTNSDGYLKAKNSFLLDIENILKSESIGRLKFKHRLRLKICLLLRETTLLEKYLKIKNRKRG